VVVPYFTCLYRSIKMKKSLDTECIHDEERGAPIWISGGFDTERGVRRKRKRSPGTKKRVV
jgi:hypothetical protein